MILIVTLTHRLSNTVKLFLAHELFFSRKPTPLPIPAPYEVLLNTEIFSVH